MVKCYHCGLEYDEKVCPGCGAAVDIPKNYGNNTANRTDSSQHNEVTSALGWFGWMIVASILPIIGLIIMLCCSNDKSAKNFAKANLVLIVTVFILIILLLIASFFIPLIF